MEQQNNQKLIEQGMSLTASLPDIMPDMASEQVKKVYEDIQHTLRVPFVNLIFRTLANYPDYFVSGWQHLSPVFRTTVFERLADEVRGMGLLEQDQSLSKIDWKQQSDLEEIRAFNDTIFYVLPKLLLVAAAFDEATFGVGKESSPSANSATEISRGIAEGTTKVQMVEPRKAGGKVKDLFESIKERHGHPLVSSYYRALGNWPDFLDTAWNRISPIVGSAAYEDQKQIVIKHAFSGISELSVPKLQDLKLNQQQQPEVKLILAAFRLKFIPEMLVDVALIKVLLDGRASAKVSKFSVAGKAIEPAK